MNIDISVIIPFLNEEENIPSLLIELEECFSKHEEKIQVVFIDDGSTDQSLAMLRSFEPKFFLKKIVRLSKNYGAHAAIRSGLLLCDGKFSTILSSDLQDDPSSIFDYYREAIRTDADSIILYREQYKASYLNKIFSGLYVLLVRFLVSPNFPKNNITNFFINSKVRKVLNENIALNSSIFLQIYFIGFKQVFMSYKQRTRNKGKSKWTLTKKAKLFIDSIISFSYKPLRIITLLGVLSSFIGVMYLLFILITYLLNREYQSGWPTLISVILIGFGLTNVSLGVMSEYLWRISEGVKKTPVFIVEDVYE